MDAGLQSIANNDAHILALKGDTDASENLA